MQCRNCGASIADKALICYKCGTATTEAKYQPAPLTRTSSRSGLVATIVALALLVVAALSVERASAAAGSSHLVTYATVAAAVIIIVIRAYARRR
jgi:FtsH-binding integral membrane protein